MQFQLTQPGSGALRELSDLMLLLGPGFLGTSQQGTQVAISEGMRRASVSTHHLRSLVGVRQLLDPPHI